MQNTQIITNGKTLVRTDTTEQWQSANPVLANGEPAYDSKANTLKIGDGKSNYDALPSLGGGGNNIIDLIYPVGTYWWNENPINPNELYAGTTWEQVKDRFVLAAGDDYNAQATGGEATVTLTKEQTPAHTHTRGTMNITGDFQGSRSGASTGYVAPSGAFVRGSGFDSYTAGGSDMYSVSFDASRSWTGETSSVGGGKAHNNMPPYIVAYCWKRIA